MEEDDGQDCLHFSFVLCFERVQHIVLRRNECHGFAVWAALLRRVDGAWGATEGRGHGNDQGWAHTHPQTEALINHDPRRCFRLFSSLLAVATACGVSIDRPSIAKTPNNNVMQWRKHICHHYTDRPEISEIFAACRPHASSFQNKPAITRICW